MRSADKQFFKFLGLIAAIVGFAVLSHSVIMYTHSIFLNNILVFIKTFCCLGLFAVWGVTVSKRVMQKDVRKMLMAVSALMVFWITAREFKFRFIGDPFAIRLLWYSYYIPILFIPLIALFVSIIIGKGEDYRLPKRIVCLIIPTAILLVLMLTNDLHQLAFEFPKGSVWSDRNYSYGILYYIVTIWASLCSLTAFAIMFSKTRLPNRSRAFWMPLIPIALCLIYAVLYALRVPFVTKYLSDMAVSFCLFFMSFFEGCIQSGLIQTNIRYYDMFKASADISIQITDRNYTVHHCSGDARQFIPLDDMKRAEKQPIIIGGGKLLHNMPINGGHAVWTEDISTLMEICEKLQDRGDELRDRNELLQYEYEKERQHQTVKEKNRLYDLLQSKTQAQIDEIDRLVKRYATEHNKAEKHRILAHIVVLGSYIKRRKDFVISADVGADSFEAMLRLAFGESLHSLKLLDIQGVFSVDTQNESNSLGAMTLAYDFFQSVVETILDNAHYINVVVCKVNSRLRVSIVTDYIGNSGALNTKYPAVQIIADDEGTTFILPLEGGEPYD